VNDLRANHYDLTVAQVPPENLGFEKNPSQAVDKHDLPVAIHRRLRRHPAAFCTMYTTSGTSLSRA